MIQQSAGKLISKLVPLQETRTGSRTSDSSSITGVMTGMPRDRRQNPVRSGREHLVSGYGLAGLGGTD
jgi:hypothetical protein